MTGLRWQNHQQDFWCAWRQFRYLLLINHSIFPPSASIQLYTVHMGGRWHGRTYYHWQMTPQENCLKHRLHRWSIATVSVLGLFSFPFTWSRITAENLNWHRLQDSSLLSNNSPGSPQQCLCHICDSQAWAVPLPDAQKRFRSSDILGWQGAPICLAWSWYSNHHIKTRIITAPAHPGCPEMTNLLAVLPLTSH